MKSSSRYNRLSILLIILSVSMAGCPGAEVVIVHSSNAPSRDAPSLSALNLSPTSADQYSGNGTTVVNFSSSFIDDGGDVTSMTRVVYDGKGAVLDSATNPCEGDAGMKAGSLQGAFSLDTTKAGNYKITLFVTDSGGLTSSVAESTFTVIPRAGLVSLEVTPAVATIESGSTQQFAAVGTYDDNTVVDITSLVYWTSSNATAATIDNQGYNGRATGKTRGTTTVTATKNTVFGQVSGQSVLTVLSDFGPVVQYPGPDQLQYLGNTAIGDLNGDGRNDVAVINVFNNGSHVYIYYQKADFTLDAPQVITTDLNLLNVKIADMDDDGLADLVVSGITYFPASGNWISVYKQDAATHALGAPRTYPISSYAASFAAADLNNDGRTDIAAAGNDVNSKGLVSFLFQGPDGMLASEVTYTWTSVFGDEAMHVADMNNDGLNDIVLQSGPKQLAVVKQISPGIFSSTPDYYSLSSNLWPIFNSFALGDLNNDGRTDIVAVDIVEDGDLNILLQDKNGLLSGPTLTLPYGGDEVHIADMNGDGLNDIVLFVVGHQVRILYQAADHTFSKARSYDLAACFGRSLHQTMSIGDVTGDALPDIVTSCSEYGIAVLPRLP